MKFTIFDSEGKAIRQGGCPERDLEKQYDSEKGETLELGHYRIWKPGKPIIKELICEERKQLISSRNKIVDA